MENWRKRRAHAREAEEFQLDRIRSLVLGASWPAVVALASFVGWGMNHPVINVTMFWLLLIGTNLISYVVTVIAFNEIMRRAAHAAADSKQTLIDTQDRAIDAARFDGHEAGRAELAAEIGAETPPVLLACLQAILRDQENVTNYPRIGERVSRVLNSKNYEEFRRVIRAFRDDDIVIRNPGLADLWRLNLMAFDLTNI